MQHCPVLDAGLVRVPHMAGLCLAPSAALLRQVGPALVTHQMHVGTHGHHHPATCYQLTDQPGPLPGCSQAALQARAFPVCCYRLQDMRPDLLSKIGNSHSCYEQHPSRRVQLHVTCRRCLYLHTSPPLVLQRLND